MQPNGVVLSPDGSTAYITDTGLFRPGVRTSPHTVYAFDVVRTECAASLTSSTSAAVLTCHIESAPEGTGNAARDGICLPPES